MENRQSCKIVHGIKYFVKITLYLFVQIQSSHVTEGVSLGDRKRLTPGHKTESFRAGGMDVYHHSKIFMGDLVNFCHLVN